MKPKRVARQVVADTIKFVAQVAAYESMDGRDPSRFLRSQTCARSDTPQPLRVIFEAGAFARVHVFVDEELNLVDFADLLVFPGYRHVHIGRVNGGKMTARCVRELQRRVEQDLYYDYKKSEIRLRFERGEFGLSAEVTEIA